MDAVRVGDLRRVQRPLVRPPCFTPGSVHDVLLWLWCLGCLATGGVFVLVWLGGRSFGRSVVSLFVWLGGPSVVP